MNQRTFLGLTHNPFNAPREGFYAGADRKTHLDQLRHLSQWSRRILVVTGPFGMGKSTLFRELSGSLETGVKAARLSGTVVASEREALVGLLQGFGVAAGLDMHTADLIEVVKQYVAEQDELGRICIAMVDDAHLLNPGAIDCLIKIVEGSPLRLLLFAEASLITDLSRAAKLHDLEWFEIRLTGFPKADARDYLEWRFQQAHYRGRLPFTDEQLDKIVQRSKGNPSVIDSMANRLLADLESGDIRAEGGKFPVTHLVLALSLVVLVSLVYLFVQDPQTSAVQDVAVEAIELPAEEEVESGQSDQDLGELQSSMDLPTEREVNQPDLTGESVELSTLQVASGVDPAKDADPVQVASAMASESSESSEVLPEVIVEPVLVAQADGEPAKLETEKAQTQQPVPAPIKEIVADTSTDRAVPVEESIAAPIKVEEPVAAKPTPRPTSVSTPAAPIRYKSAQWILNQPAERFTMQLLTLSSLRRAEAFINRQANPEEFGLYRMRRDGKQLYVVIYGVFSGRPGAQAAIAGFTGELGKIKPWIRSMALVQDTIRNNQQ